MGTAKYPAESGYLDFLTSNGGGRNASTASEYTNYFFLCSDKAFPEAFDRLAQIIQTPILSVNSMQREREAVDSEYQMNKSNDAVRFLGLFNSLVRESHPASQFHIGNLKTLKDDISDEDLHAELVKFQKKYVGKKTVIALQSKRPLNEMQEFVVSSFSGMKKENLNEIDRTTPRNVDEIFKPEFFNKIFYIKPIALSGAMFMSFAIPSVLKSYKCSPLDYLSQIFENEGEGGLSNYLREKNLIGAIGLLHQPNTIWSNSQYSVAQIFVDLTEQGMANLGEVLEAIFSYLLMIKQTPIAEHRRLWNDLKDKNDIDFKYFAESTPDENVKNFTSQMLMYEDVDIIRGSNLLLEFNEKEIVDVIEAFNKMKFNIALFDENHESYNKKEKYYGGEYDEVEMPAEYKRLWNERKLNPEFHLEKPNPFKATSFDIYEDEMESTVSFKIILNEFLFNNFFLLHRNIQQKSVMTMSFKFGTSSTVNLTSRKSSFV
jgi:nardilysin